MVSNASDTFSFAMFLFYNELLIFRAFEKIIMHSKTVLRRILINISRKLNFLQTSNTEAKLSFAPLAIKQVKD